VQTFNDRSHVPARVVRFSSKSPLAVVHYPDSGKVGISTEGDD
jgi:hypothetical protein